MLTWAEEKGSITGAPHLESPSAEDVAVETKERRPMTVEQREPFLAAAEKLSPRMARIYRVLFWTACRKSDLVFGPFDFHKEFPALLTAAEITDVDGLTAHHVTRHTACTLAGAAGATLAEIMAMGRWTTPQMAMRYMKINAERSKGALSRL